MSDKIEVTGQEVPGGKVPKMVNSPQDCPTIVVDGVTGVTISSHMVRVHLVEHISVENEALGRHVMNMAMDAEQFQKLIAALVLVRDQMAPAADTSA